MGKHANVAVETLNTYHGQREKLNDWLDQFYETQCAIASQIVTLAGRENLTRQDMQDIADSLNVRHIYVFDQKGPALRSLNREMKLIFDRHGIEIPFNQLVVHEVKES